MLRAFQEMFVDPVDDSPLTFEGELRDGCWHNGYLRSSRGETWPVREGIPDFLRRKFQGPCGCRSAADLPYEQNWRNGSRVLTEKDSGFAEACREAANCGHPVIDIASGPGGGFMPPLLALNPNAIVMATDIATQVLHGWKEYFDSQGISLSVCFVGFDARKMPLASNSVEIITSAMGFSSVGSVGDILTAFREAAGVLTDDGIIYAAEAGIEQEGMKILSSKMGWDFE